MQSYRWPGNVRELHGVVERMYILSGNSTLTLQDLPQDIAQLLPRLAGAALAENASSQLNRIEADAIRVALTQSNLNLSQIAARLGISRTTLYRRMKSHGIERSH